MRLRRLIVLTVSSLLAAVAVGQADTTPPTAIVPGKGFEGELVRNRLLVKMRPDRAAALRASVGLRRITAIELGINGAFANQIGPSGWTLWLLAPGEDSVSLAPRIMKRPGVFLAAPANRVTVLWTEPNDPDFRAIEDREEMIFNASEDPVTFRRCWNLGDIGAEEGWSDWPDQWYTAANKPTNTPAIAVIDTGAEMNHPDFRNTGGAGANTTQGGQIEYAKSYEFRSGAVYPAGSAQDLYGHGTHVTGLAVAAGNNGAYNAHGVIGVGYNAKGWILRVFDDELFATDAEAAAAIYWAADNGADILNLSLGTPNYSQLMQDAVTHAFQKGCLIVAAAGNNAAEQLFYPAACSGAMGVSALSADYQPATSYTNRGNHVDIAAPGGDVIMDFVNNIFYFQYIFSTTKLTTHYLYENRESLGLVGYDLGHGYLIGTSMATPQVSGAAGLYYGKFNLRQDQGWANVRAYQAIEKTAFQAAPQSGGTWETNYGYGVLDVQGLLLDSNVRGSTVGAIEGRIYKNTTPTANVAVKAKNIVTNQQFQTTSLPDGSYRFQYLVPGTYDITAAPDGQVKTLRRVIKEGCDLPGVDFWCGTFTWDTNPPEVPRFQILSNTETTMMVRHRAFDPETGLDSIVWRIGTTDGGSEVMADKPILPVDSDTEVLNGLTLGNGTYYLRGTYTNGAGMTTVVTATLSTGTAVTGTATMTGYSSSYANRSLTVVIRNPGSTTALETHAVTPASNGSFTVYTDLNGTRDIAVKYPHGLRSVLANVNIPAGGVSGLTFTSGNGDVNGDNSVNLADFLALRAAFGSSAGGGTWNPNADLNGDGSVNLADFLILRSNFGQSGNP